MCVFSSFPSSSLCYFNNIFISCSYFIQILLLYYKQLRNELQIVFFITHIDKFFHNSPVTGRLRGTPRFLSGYSENALFTNLLLILFSRFYCHISNTEQHKSSRYLITCCFFSRYVTDIYFFTATSKIMMFYYVLLHQGIFLC